MLKARGVVSHGVSVPGEEVCNVAVAVEALMVAGVAAERCGGAGSGHCPLAHSGDGRGVVGKVLEGGVADIMGLRHGVYLGQ